VIALFPLNIVLFPGGPLPLRIFETRYVDMVGRCMREGAGFGAVYETSDVGTLADIVARIRCATVQPFDRPPHTDPLV
jgi:hypothetical protein